MQPQAKSRMCPLRVPLGQRDALLGKGGIAAVSPQHPASRPVCGQRQEEGCWGVRLSTGIGVHRLGPTPLKLLAEVA